MSIRSQFEKWAYNNCSNTETIMSAMEAFNLLAPCLEALDGILPVLTMSSDVKELKTVYLTPAEELRRAATEIEARDAAIRKAREALAKLRQDLGVKEGE